MMRMNFIGLVLIASIGLGACQMTQQTADHSGAIAEVVARDVSFDSYPAPGVTYLVFDRAHGFQVNYLGTGGKSWLWYPGNARGVPEEWKRDRDSGVDVICFRHPSSSYNPVTKTKGGKFACQDLVFSKKGVVASLKGDPFKLGSGAVPYRMPRCKAPDAFRFDRERFSC